MLIPLLALIAFLLLSAQFGVIPAIGGLIVGVLGLFLEPIVGWWYDRAKAWCHAHSPRTKSDNFDSP